MYSGNPTLGFRRGYSDITPLNTPNYNINLNKTRIQSPKYSLKRFMLNRRQVAQVDKIRVQSGGFIVKPTAYTVNDNYNRQIVLTPQYEL